MAHPPSICQAGNLANHARTSQQNDWKLTGGSGWSNPSKPRPGTAQQLGLPASTTGVVVSNISPSSLLAVRTAPGRRDSGSESSTGEERDTGGSCDPQGRLECLAARQSPGQHDVHRHIEVIGQPPARPDVRVCRSNDRENPAGTKSVPAGFFVFTGSRDRTTGVHKKYLREVLWRRRLAGGFPSPPSAKPPARRRRHEMQALLSEGHPRRRYDPSWLKVERSLGFTFTFAGSETDDPVYSSND